MTIPAQKAKTVLSFVIYNELGNRLVTKKVTVKAAKVSAAKTVKATPQKVTGKATKNTSVSIYKGTKKIRTTKVTTKGTFAVSIPKQKKGTVLKIIVADTAGNKSTAKRIQVR
ncbi:Ig-like domain-containing protein [Kurthia senegalensis]|uniref:Ig-like domain-containing protein n=1 Tax=Kurthia senegalensis TaxID=1033740 RepID=UPI000289E04D|nr:Ig-like domain-containing protein [Kurthia senegalensis]